VCTRCWPSLGVHRISQWRGWNPTDTQQDLRRKVPLPTAYIHMVNIISHNTWSNNQMAKRDKISHFSCSMTILVILTSHTTGEMANGMVLKLFRLQFVSRNIFQYVQLKVWTFPPNALLLCISQCWPLCQEYLLQRTYTWLVWCLSTRLPLAISRIFFSVRFCIHLYSP